MNYLYSVSGGRTSGYMASLARMLHPSDNILFIFANTGKEDEETLIFFREMEKLHKFSGSNDGINGRVFFRKNRSYDDLYAEYLASDFEGFVDPRFNKNLDLNGGCSESCELYETE